VIPPRPRHRGRPTGPCPTRPAAGRGRGCRGHSSNTDSGSRSHVPGTPSERIGARSRTLNRSRLRAPGPRSGPPRAGGRIRR
jgi:hypothetical protein